MTIRLNGSDLTVTQVVAAARHGDAVTLHQLRLHQLRLLLAGSYLWQPGAARFLQDPLTFRCIPHIHGAARDALDYARNILHLELNSSQSDPVVVVPAGDERGRIVVSVGNFDTGPLAAALDFLRIALAPVVTSAGRAYRMIRELVPFTQAGATLPADLEPLVGLLSGGTLTPAA